MLCKQDVVDIAGAVKGEYCGCSRCSIRRMLFM